MRHVPLAKRSSSLLVLTAAVGMIICSSPAQLLSSTTADLEAPAPPRCSSLAADSASVSEPFPVTSLDLLLTKPLALTLPDAPGIADTGIVHPRLLPDNMSLMETALWGESGLARSTGLYAYTVEDRKLELSLRRTMLSIHQVGGFVTLGLFVPTLILGQRNIQNWNDATSGIHPLDRNLNRTHHTIAMITFASYMTTGALAILSPPPLVRRDGWNTVTVHKTLAWVHFTGMIATPILAALASKASTAQRARDLRTAHEIAAYTTAAALTASLIIVTF